MKKHWRTLSVYGICLIGLCLEWFLFKQGAGIGYPNPIATLMKCIGDCAIILLPFFLLKPRWRWSVVLPLWVYGIWSVANLIYFRFWHDLIPPAAITMGGNVNGNLAGYAFSLLCGSDALFVIIPVVASIIVRILHASVETKLPTYGKIGGLICSLIVFILGQTSYYISHKSWLKEYGVTGLSESLKDHFIGDRVSSIARYEIDGLAMYLIHFPIDAAAQLLSATSLSDEERSEVDAFLARYDVPTSNTPIDVDSMNIAYIIVESLNSEVLNNTVNGLRITPTLDSLASLSGTVLFDNVVSQVKLANSSDGHLLLMSGLLPPNKIAYCFKFGGSNNFHTLSEALPNHFKHTYLGDDAKFWNKAAIVKNLGLGEITRISDMNHNNEVAGVDETLLKYTASVMDTLQTPFFITLMTMSMHMPFHEASWEMPKEIATSNIDEQRKDYYTVTYYFDKYLGEFVKSLPSNTIIIIASDHSVELKDGPMYPPSVFMAVNVGRTEHVSRVVGQVNLFPATLELLGLDLPNYGGLAPSGLNPCVDGSIDANGNIYGTPSSAAIDTLITAFRLSDLIIRSNAFK